MSLVWRGIYFLIVLLTKSKQKQVYTIIIYTSKKLNNAQYTDKEYTNIWIYKSMKNNSDRKLAHYNNIKYTPLHNSSYGIAIRIDCNWFNHRKG